MPDSASILESLASAANELWLVSVAWHVAIASAVIALAVGRWRPTVRVAAVVLSAPLFSVSIVGWARGNPFNGAVFLALAAGLGLLSARLPRVTVERGPTWATIVGAASIAYAWLYPHFLETENAWTYLVAAPTGLLPCPTLALILGFGLLAGGFNSHAWSIATAIAGMFYGLFGIFALRVWLDAGLLVAALALLAAALAPPVRHQLRHRARSPVRHP